MKELYAKDIRENDLIDGFFLVRSKSLSVGKTGKPYIVTSLMDKTGELEGRVWDNAETISDHFDADDFVSVKGRASSYLGKIQLKINDIKKVDDSDVDVEDFLPVSVVPPTEMLSNLSAIVQTVSDPHIGTLLKLLFEDRPLMEAFSKAPAAKGMHHVYIGGLLEHVLSMCRLVDMVSSHYGDKINRDLLIAGAIFHDIGKTRELSYSRSFNYTDEGRLIGHISIGVEMLDEKLRSMDGFPLELSLLLKHMLLSHHSEYAYGSPKRPKTLEATMLGYIDDMDAKVNSIQSLLEAENGSDSDWTGYHRLFERYIYKGNGKNLSSEAVKAVPAGERAEQNQAQKPAYS
ncbi:MAG: HD domain-containing protein [bacterium]|nr:HD domain-containing protein [bacterium]